MRKCLTAGSHGGISSTETPSSDDACLSQADTQNQPVQTIDVFSPITAYTDPASTVNVGQWEVTFHLSSSWDYLCVKCQA